MISRTLISFDRNKFEDKADLSEKIGNVGLGLLRIGFGKHASVEHITSRNGVFFSKKNYSTSARVAAIAIFILAIPFTTLLAGIGLIGTHCSKSHELIFGLYREREQLEGRAATIIQKYARRHLARKAFLPLNPFSKYHVLCEKASGPKSDSMSRAQGGQTRVYLPSEIPNVILKWSGRTKAIKRFHQMQQVRSTLNSQNISHLIIPKASLCGDFLVEERLPINVDSYHNMGLYLSQPTLFDEAVREMTRLFSKSYLDDLISNVVNPLGHIENVGDFVRYDNLPLYIVETNGKKEGKIGLIDLEYIGEPSSNGLEALARIFPLHLDIIKDEANKLKLKVNENSLQLSAEKGKKYLQVGFIDHLKWLQKKGISHDNAFHSFELSPEREEKLKDVIEKELIKLNEGVNDLFKKVGYLDTPQKHFFIENPEEIAKELAATISPLMIKNLKFQIEEKQEEQAKGLTEPFMNDSEMVSLRSPIIERPKIYKDVVKLIATNQKIKFKERGIFEPNDIADQLLFVFMKELVKGGELFFFDPAYYSGGHHSCWVRY